jgi:peroxiredoxin
VGISVDSPKGVKTVAEVQKVPFPMLSDQDLVGHNIFYVLQPVENETFEKYEGWGFNLEGWSGRDHHTVAVPAVFLVDKDLTVLWAHGSRDHRTRPSAQQVLAEIRKVLPPR